MDGCRIDDLVSMTDRHYSMLKSTHCLQFQQQHEFLYVHGVCSWYVVCSSVRPSVCPSIWHIHVWVIVEYFFSCLRSFARLLGLFKLKLRTFMFLMMKYVAISIFLHTINTHTHTWSHHYHHRHDLINTNKYGCQMLRQVKLYSMVCLRFFFLFKTFYFFGIHGRRRTDLSFIAHANGMKCVGCPSITLRLPWI